jgi:hypothetical protein
VTILRPCGYDLPRSPKFAIFLLIVIVGGRAQTKAPEWAEGLVRDVRAQSFPELSQAEIRARPFVSHSDYFRARFSIVRFFFGKEM